MGEQPKTTLSFPYIGTEEVMLRLGLSEQTAYIGTAAATREYVGMELRRASAWLRIRTGWTETEVDIPDDKKQLIADIVVMRISGFYYQRLAGMRLDRADDFRILSRENFDRADASITYIMKERWFSVNITKKETTIKEE